MATVEQMWQEYRESTGGDPKLVAAFAFGNTAKMADELVDLVLRGPKRATAGLLLDYEREDEPVPEPGEHWVLLDSREEAVCVVRVTDAEVKPLNQVDAAFAWDEGEGDRTLEWWTNAHHRYFSRHCAATGVTFSDDLPTVFVRFELVWPARV